MTTTLATPTAVRRSLQHEIDNIDRWLAVKSHKWAHQVGRPSPEEVHHVDEMLDQRLEYMRALGEV